MMLDTCTETGVRKIVHGWPVESYAIGDGDNVVVGVVRTGENGDYPSLSLALTSQEMRHFLEVARGFGRGRVGRDSMNAACCAERPAEARAYTCRCGVRRRLTQDGWIKVEAR